MQLAQNVRNFYLDHFQELPFDKQFHFASRLSAWNQDAACITILENLKPQLYPADKPIRELLHDIITNLPDNPINAAELRAPYFAKYPTLRGEMLALFRVRHLLSIYNIDVRQDFLEVVPYESLHNLAASLIKDTAALKTLSTYAINYLYLVEHILFDRQTGTLDVDELLKIGGSYDLKDPHDMLLFIYFYTHCIIGETNFYERGISPERQPLYINMLEQIEAVISEHFDDINLDNKLEFLVCCRIAGHNTPIAARIYDECTQSLSPEGTFLIDTLNNAKQTSKASFAQSEHRNVLFIMSTLPYGHAASESK